MSSVEQNVENIFNGYKKKMALKLYKLDESPPARAAMMICGLLDLPVEMIDVNLMAGKHLDPDYLKKNPLHTVPTLEDGKLIIMDSHAILMYLADAYSKDDSLYPKDAKQRALVNQKLFFDTSILFPRLRNITYPIVVKGEKTLHDQQLLDIIEAYSFMEQFLSNAKYLAGDNMTIADISVYSDMSSLTHLCELDINKYPKTKAWMTEMENKRFAKTYNAPGANSLAKYVNASIGDVLRSKKLNLTI